MRMCRPHGALPEKSLLSWMMKGMGVMDRLESLVVAYKFVAMYAFCCAEVISALMIASRSRALVFIVFALFIVGTVFLPAGYGY